MDGYTWIIYSFISLSVAAGLGLIPANIAKRKGYSFGLWWFYGWMLFIVALIHVCIIPDKNAKQFPIYQSVPQPSIQQTAKSAKTELGAADELKKYKELFDRGAITEEEYNLKKSQLLKQL